MQVTTRYLCLSGTLLGWAAESSCIFCTNVAAVADKHLAEIKGGFGICSPWYGTGHTTRSSAWTQTNAHQMSCARSWDHLFWKKKKGYTTPLFSINRWGGAGCPLLRRRVRRQCHPLQSSHPEHSVLQLFSGAGWEAWSQHLSNVFQHRVYVELSLYIGFSQEALDLCCRVVYLQGPFHAFLIPELGSYVRSPSNSLFMQSYSKGKKQEKVVAIPLTPGQAE